MVRPVLLSFLCVVMASRAAAVPEIFDDRPLADIFIDAQERDRFVIVFACADWNAQSRQMDRAVWTDPELVAWIRENAIAARLDADRDRAVAERFGIRRFPGILLFKGGAPRPPGLPGYRTAENVLRFLRAAEEYERTGSRPEDLADQIAGPDGARIAGTLSRAIELLDQDDTEQTAEVLRWLWDNIVPADSAYTGVRRTLLLESVSKLADLHEPSDAHFRQRLAGSRAALDAGTASWTELRDWIVLSDALGMGDDVVEWAQSMSERGEEGVAVLRRVGATLPPVLIRAGRFDLASELVGSPAESSSRASLMLDVVRRSGFDNLLERADEIAAERAIEYYLLALYQERRGGPASEPDAISRSLFARSSDIGSTRRTLCTAAIDAGLANNVHLEWIRALPASDENRALLARLQDAINNDPPETDPDTTGQTTGGP